MEPIIVYGPQYVVLAGAPTNQLVRIRLITLGTQYEPILQVSDGKDPEAWLSVSAIVTDYRNTGAKP
jgi:hypothetical protein